MCEACDDNEDINFLEQIPEDEREEFFEFACTQFASVIDKAEEHNVLAELITEWPKAKQAAFAFAVVLENRGKQLSEIIFDDEEDYGQ